MLNDHDFAQQFSLEIGEEYRRAKSYVHDVPTQTLLHVRSITHQLLQLLAAPQQLTFQSPNLFDRIEQLHQARMIDSRLARKLHKLRAGGNRGAHPEKFHLTLAQLVQLAEKSITDLLVVLENSYAACIGQVIPTYQFIAFDSIAGRDLCYRAVMENDPEARYLVGMSLKSKALLLQEQQDILLDHTLEFESDQQLQNKTKANQEIADSFCQASYWFSLAAEQNPKAQFEYGVALLHGYGVEQKIAKAEVEIAKAASQKVPEAMALLGYFYLVGSDTLSQDPAQAEHFLKMAANEDVLEAMANLGVCFYQQGQFEQAYRWINKAAQAGYPHSQYHLALMLAQGEGCEMDAHLSQKWMREAAAQEQVDAMLTVARSCLDQQQDANTNDNLPNDHSPLTLSEAESYLQKAIQYGQSVPAMIELSIALADGILGRIDVVGSAALLNMAKRRANDEELEVISPLWHSLAQQIEQVIVLTEQTGELKALNRARELLRV